MANPEPEMKPLSLRYLVARYTVVMVLVGIVLAIVDFLLQYFFQFQSGAGVGIVAVIVPAMDAGQVFARRMARLPDSAEAWRLSAIMLAVNVAFGAVIVVLLTLILGWDSQMATAFSAIITPLGLGLMAGMLGIFYLATRFFFGSGAKNEMKRRARVSKKQE